MSLRHKNNKQPLWEKFSGIIENTWDVQRLESAGSVLTKNICLAAWHQGLFCLSKPSRIRRPRYQLFQIHFRHVAPLLQPRFCPQDACECSGQCGQLVTSSVSVVYSSVCIYTFSNLRHYRSFFELWLENVYISYVRRKLVERPRQEVDNKQVKHVEWENTIGQECSSLSSSAFKAWMAEIPTKISCSSQNEENRIWSWKTNRSPCHVLAYRARVLSLNHKSHFSITETPSSIINV